VRKKFLARGLVPIACLGLLGAAITPVAASAATSGGNIPTPALSAKGTPIVHTVHAVDATPAVLALMKAQEKVDRAADRIQAAVPGGSLVSGLGGIIVDPSHSAVRVYWHGPVPPVVAHQIATERRAGTVVTTATALYTQARLVRDAQKLTGASDPARTHIAVAGPNPDGSGLSVQVTGWSAQSAGTRRALVAGLAGDDVRLEVSAGPDPMAATRQADTPPYWGGALIQNASSECTSGFGVTGNNGVATYILTAAHCGGGTFTTGAGVTMGSSIETTWTHDAQLILTNAGAGGYVYDGASIAGGNQFAKPVAGASANHVGDFVCTSGAFSGAVCNIKIVALNDSFTLDGHAMSGMVRAEQQSHVDAAGNGDSGGPAFSLTNSNADDVARGTITAYDGAHTVSCAGVPSGNGRACSWRIWFPSVTTEMSDLGVHINTF